MNEKQRGDALADFDQAWATAIDTAARHERALDHLARAMTSMAAVGVHVMVTFPSPVAQEWWVTYSERNGNLIPRTPAEAPIPTATG